MLIIQILIILFLGYVLKLMYSYISNNIAQLGPGQRIVSNIIIGVIFLNILFMILLLIYTTYVNEWKMIGEPGEEGEEGPKGDVGDGKCKKNTESNQPQNC
jgi:hypothetical protein